MRRVLVCGAWDDGPGYPRSRSLLMALAHGGYQVHECRVPAVVVGRSKQRLASRPWRWPGLVCRLRGMRARLQREVRLACASYAPDIVVVPYPGHVLVPWVRQVFTGPIVLDLFLSAYDTTVLDRAALPQGSLAARALAWLDRRACRAADLVLLDTPEHAAWIAELTRLPVTHFDWVPVHDPDAPAVPSAWRPPAAPGPLELLFFGTGVPLHGLPYLLAAVARTPGIRLTLIGGTPADRTTVSSWPGDRVRLLDGFVARDELAAELDRCHLVAGIFAAAGKSHRVVPFKVVHALAAGRPVLTADTPAIRRFLTPGRDCLVCPGGDADRLAAVLEQVVAAPQCLAPIAQRARAAYEAHFGIEALATRLSRVLTPLSRTVHTATATPVPVAG